MFRFIEYLSLLIAFITESNVVLDRQFRVSARLYRILGEGLLQHIPNLNLHATKVFNLALFYGQPPHVENSF